jgi:hypothetical protein
MSDFLLKLWISSSSCFLSLSLLVVIFFGFVNMYVYFLLVSIEDCFSAWRMSYCYLF